MADIVREASVLFFAGVFFAWLVDALERKLRIGKLIFWGIAAYVAFVAAGIHFGWAAADSVPSVGVDVLSDWQRYAFLLSGAFLTSGFFDRKTGTCGVLRGAGLAFQEFAVIGTVLVPIFWGLYLFGIFPKFDFTFLLMFFTIQAVRSRAQERLKRENEESGEPSADAEE